MPKLKACKQCGGTGHTAFNCPRRPRKQLAKSSMKPKGKKTDKWLAFRKQYLRHHLPNHQGYYECYICHGWVHSSEVELDHVLSRSRHPELVFDETNIKPVCHCCNVEKGSTDGQMETSKEPSPPLATQPPDS